ncbi:hypothetical protein WA158_002804 [Blastocystis sp. Blastoise]
MSDTIKPIVDDIQEPPPGTTESCGTSCWKCNGTGNLTIKKQKRVCNVCNGNKIIISEVRRKLYHQPGKIMEERRWPKDYIIPGPTCCGFQENPELQPKEGESLCSLAGYWKIFQRQGGHRFSTDDIVTAWCASQYILSSGLDKIDGIPYLDIGCGLGSVLLFISWKFSSFQSVGIEAQKISYSLAKRSILYNIGNSDRIKVYNGDLRDFNILSNDKKFKIITGTPPYFKNGEAALPSKVDQKACLFEFRGGVEEYCRAAGHYLTEDGHFFVVESYLCKERIDEGAKLYDLEIVERWDIIPKEGKPALICVAHLKRKSNTVSKYYPLHIIIIRNKENQHTHQYNQILIDMGFPPQRNVGDVEDAIIESEENDQKKE